MAVSGQTYWTECGRASKSTRGSGCDAVDVFLAMAAVGRGGRASNKAEQWRDEQAAVHAVKKAAQAELKGRGAERHQGTQAASNLSSQSSLSAFHRGSGATDGTCLGCGRDRQQGWGSMAVLGATGRARPMAAPAGTRKKKGGRGRLQARNAQREGQRGRGLIRESNEQGEGREWYGI
jgi:hypothetical protein